MPPPRKGGRWTWTCCAAAFIWFCVSSSGHGEKRWWKKEGNGTCFCFLLSALCIISMIMISHPNSIGKLTFALSHKFNIDSLTIIALTSQKFKKNRKNRKKRSKVLAYLSNFYKTTRLLPSFLGKLFTKRYPHKKLSISTIYVYYTTIPHKPIQHEQQLKTEEEEENTEIRNTRNTYYTIL